MPVSRSAASSPATAPPPTGSDKRARILAAAEDLFYRNGFAGTTMDMICAELGVTKPFVYYYFKDKHEIVETLAWHATVACLTTMKFPPDDRRPATVRLAEGLQRWVAACIAHFRASALAFRVTASLRPEFRTELGRLADDFYADLGALMEQGRRDGALCFEDTTVTARAMGGAVGFIYTWYRPDGRLPPEELADRLTATLFRMIGLNDAASRPLQPAPKRKRNHPQRTIS
jgi:AcrR family transcriptional regulator